MNTQFQKQPEYKQQQGVQSFYEPTMQLLNEVLAVKAEYLKSRGHNENNAAVTKEELAQKMAYRFRITIWLAQQVISSLIKAEQLMAFGSYVKPKVSEVNP